MRTLGKTTYSETSSQSHSTTNSQSQTQSQSRSESQSESRSTTRKVYDAEILRTVLDNLSGEMTDEEIAEYAKNLLSPQLAAELEASQQNYETAKLSREQEIENLAAELTRSIEGQNSAYRQSMADVETAALSRGMGRSSYTMQSLANQGEALASAVRALTEETDRKQEQIQRQITKSAEQNAETQGRLNADYEKNLAAKMQELRSERDRNRNAGYLTALSATMGSETTQSGTSSTQKEGTQQTTGSSVTDKNSSSSTVSGTLGGSSSKKSRSAESAPAAEETASAKPTGDKKIHIPGYMGARLENR